MQSRSGPAAVRSHAGGQQAMRCGTMAQNRRARAVAEQHAGVAVFPIDDGGKFFRADDQHGVVGAGHDELLANLQSENKTGTGGLNVKGGGAAARRFFPEPGRRSDGNGMSGVMVARTIKSICSGATLARAMARRAALAARSEVHSFLAAMRRSLMPVRVVIHSSEVLTICSKVGVGKHPFGNIGADGQNGAGAALEIMPGARVFEFFINDFVMIWLAATRWLAWAASDANHVGNVMFHRLDGLADAVHDGAFAGGAVRLEDDAIEAEQGRSAPRVGVGAAFDGAQGRL